MIFIYCLGFSNVFKPIRMNLKENLYLDVEKLRSLYESYLPILCKNAMECELYADFQIFLIDYLDQFKTKNAAAVATIKTLLDFEGREIYELSTESNIQLKSLHLLLDFLKKESFLPITDLYIDLFYLFYSLEHPSLSSISREQVIKMMDRWPTALEPVVQTIVQANKQRMLPLLVAKIERRKAAGRSKYLFSEGMTHADKLQAVSSWWNDHYFQLSVAIRDPDELNEFLENSLSEASMNLFHTAKEKGMPFFITPYYLSLLTANEVGYDDTTIRSYIFYSPELVDTFGHIKAWEREDVVVPGEPNAAGWILPEGGNVHRRYPEVAILIPDTMGRACGGLCASCQRMYDFQSGHLNFDLKKLKPKETWNAKLKRLMTFFEEDKDLKDILITGGDALMAQNKSLKELLNKVLLMATRKREANFKRPENEKLAELKRVRLGSRLLAYLPMRIDAELIEILTSFRKEAMKVGIDQFILQTHFQSPLEITPEAEKAVQMILSSGWIITNQLVFNTSASRLGHTTALRAALNRLGILPYYTFSVKGFRENTAVFSPIERSVQERAVEKACGLLNEKQQEELCEQLSGEHESPALVMQHFMKKYNLPFLATDRNVLNLPGVGKSMTYRLIGYRPTGERILEFNHDRTRRHSTVIDRLGCVNIAESKSIAAYLKQMEEMGEEINWYTDIWLYTSAETAKVFPLYEYSN